MRAMLLAGFIGLLTSGCDTLAPSGGACTGEDATKLTLDIFGDEVRKEAATKEDDGPALSSSKIRATVKQLQLALEDVRTTKDDPNSTKQFCTGNIKIVFPSEVIEDANAAREAAGLNSVEDLADSSNVKSAANAFRAEINYNIQPTDDGSKVYSEMESGDAAVKFVAEVVRSHLLRASIADAKAEQDRIETEQAAAEEAASREQWAAASEEAKAENKLAVEQMAALWRAVPAGTRQQLLPVQRAWIKRKDASCRVEAANGATSEEEIGLARLRCDTREQNSRAQELRQYAAQAIEEDYSSDLSNGM